MSGERFRRTLILGDVHGAARALEQVWERAEFDPERDRLIGLGDICDGWPEVDRCFDLLLDVRRLTLILGNHDEWALEWMRTGAAPFGWFGVGGDGTVDSYARRAGVDSPMDPAATREVAKTVPTEHLRLLEDARPYLIETDRSGTRRLFAHAGWNPNRPDHRQQGHDLRLGRELWRQALGREREVGQGEAGEAGQWSAANGGADRRMTGFDEVYIGHTPTDWRRPRPVLEIWNLDQGAGWDGVLTIMDVATHEFWQSDPVPELYPGVQGRR